MRFSPLSLARSLVRAHALSLSLSLQLNTSKLQKKKRRTVTSTAWPDWTLAPTNATTFLSWQARSSSTSLARSSSCCFAAARCLDCGFFVRAAEERPAPLLCAVARPPAGAEVTSEAADFVAAAIE